MSGKIREAPAAWEEVWQECIALLRPALDDAAPGEAGELITALTGVGTLERRANPAKSRISGEDRMRVLEGCRRRARREPLCYITGKAYFMYDEFAVGEGVLIPRSDTECLVEKAAEIVYGMAENQNAGDGRIRFAEFCTGSACIAVSLVRILQKAGMDPSGVISDISETALSYAKQNAARLQVSDRLEIIRHDLLSGDFRPFAASGLPYDLILCNPPYIRSDVILQLQPEVRDYEPRLALDGGADGLAFYRILAGEAAATLLKPGGWLLAEIGYDQAGDVQSLFRQAGWFGEIQVIQDYGGQPRILAAKKAS